MGEGDVRMRPAPAASRVGCSPRPSELETAGLRAVLEGLREVLPDLSEPLDQPDAASVVEQAWDAVSQALREASAAASVTVSPLLEALRQLRLVDARLAAARSRDREVGTRRLGGVLAKLEAASSSVPDVAALAPQLICELGFDRAIISWVEDSVWVPEAVFIVNDPSWAADITRVGREHPQQLHPGLFETEIARKRRALVVTGVQQAQTRVHRPIAEASQSRSYVAAPLVSEGSVVGFVHADRFYQGRDVDDFDRELLTGFAEALRLALSRAWLAQRLVTSQRSLSAVSRGLSEAVEGVHASLLSLSPASDLAPDGSAAPPRDRPARLPGDLTPREVEVLGLIAEGRTNQSIARSLVVTEGTVKQHVKHILHKTGAGNRSEAVALWFHAMAGTGRGPRR